jgi:hypothetical protein
MERLFSRFERIRELYYLRGSTLALINRGFGEYYQCGYWAALENRGSRLFAAARGSNPLLSAVLRDPWDFRITLTSECFLTTCRSSAMLRMVLKRGTVSIFQGGLTSRLLHLQDTLPWISSHG